MRKLISVVLTLALVFCMVTMYSVEDSENGEEAIGRNALKYPWISSDDQGLLDVMKQRSERTDAKKGSKTSRVAKTNQKIKARIV